MGGPNVPDRARDLEEIIVNLEKSLAMARAAGMDRTVARLEQALAEARKLLADEEPNTPSRNGGAD